MRLFEDKERDQNYKTIIKEMKGKLNEQAPLSYVGSCYTCGETLDNFNIGSLVNEPILGGLRHRRVIAHFCSQECRKIELISQAYEH